jgi:acyl-CoA synthetase (AMP-forming)/AMP-acid ligase II
METLVAALARAAARPDVGLRFLDRREAETWWSWPEVERRALTVAGGLQALGVAPGERVALVYPTGPDFVAAFFGALLCGAAPAPLGPPARLGRLDEYHRQASRQIAAAGARVVLLEPRLRRLLGETLAVAAPELGGLALDELPAAPLRAVAVGPDDLGLVQFSSGTTAEPRPVALTHRALLEQTARLNALWPDTPEVVHTGVAWLPLHHDMGLIGFVLSAVTRPTTVTLLPPEAFAARPALWLRALARYGGTVSAAPNFAYELCVRQVPEEELEALDLSRWRVALDGAETIAPDVLRAFQERFARCGLRPEALTPVYGLAEAALAVTASAVDRPFTTRRFGREPLVAAGLAVDDPAGVELVSLGAPLPGFALRIATADDAPLAERRVGRVLVRGPSLMAGYLDQPRATAEALRDGWLDTGDLGFLCDGELFLTGRAKDVVLLRGRNHAPEEIERAVEGLPGARPASAVAASWLEEGAAGETLTLFVERRRGATAAELAALPEACRRAVVAATGLAVDRVLVLAPGTLPRTSSGKLRRGETVRRHRAGELHPPAPADAAGLATALARSRRALAAVAGEERDEPA